MSLKDFSTDELLAAIERRGYKDIRMAVLEIARDELMATVEWMAVRIAELENKLEETRARSVTNGKEICRMRTHLCDMRVRAQKAEARTQEAEDELKMAKVVIAAGYQMEKENLERAEKAERRWEEYWGQHPQCEDVYNHLQQIEFDFSLLRAFGSNAKYDEWKRAEKRKAEGSGDGT